MRAHFMADFKTHLTTSSILGVTYGAAAHAFFDVPLPTAVLAGGLCSVSGMLPDLDSDSGKPLRESLAFGAAVVAMMLVDRFEQLGMGHEWTILLFAAVYLFVRFVLGEILRDYTVHRGMFHSLPAAIIFGEIAFLLCPGPALSMRICKGGAVLLGYVSHLVLDEVYSFEWKQGNLRFKRSFGTALKMFSRNPWANISTYGKLALLTYIVVYEPGWMEEFHNRVHPHWAQATMEEEWDHSPHNMPPETASGYAADPREYASPDDDLVPVAPPSWSPNTDASSYGEVPRYDPEYTAQGYVPRGYEAREYTSGGYAPTEYAPRADASRPYVPSEYPPERYSSPDYPTDARTADRSSYPY